MNLYLENFKRSVFYKIYLIFNKNNSNSQSVTKIKNSSIFIFWLNIYFFKKITFYILLHPQKIPKCLYILIVSGPSELLNKYIIAQKREELKLKKKHYPLIIKRIIVSILYIIFFSLFFIFSTIIKLIYSLFSKEFSITKSKTIIDGVSFIIPTWNKKNLLLKCLALLDLHLSREKTDIKKEIIIIENGSTDGTVEALSKLNIKIPIILLKQPINLGFAKAINLGLKQAKYNYVYLINNDMEPQQNFFSSIIDFAQKLLKQNKIFFGLSSQIFFFDPKKRREESGNTYILPNLGYVTVSHLVQEESLKTPTYTLYPGGGSSLINKYYLLKIGGYDYKIYTPLYCEDLDAGFIAWKLGLPSYFVPNSHIIHHHRSSSTRLFQNPSYFMYKNWLVLILKNFDSSKNIITHLLLYPVKIVLSNSYSDYALSALQNIVDIFLSKIRLYKYITINSDQFLINFPKFFSNLK